VAGARSAGSDCRRRKRTSSKVHRQGSKNVSELGAIDNLLYLARGPAHQRLIAIGHPDNFAFELITHGSVRRINRLRVRDHPGLSLHNHGVSFHHGRLLPLRRFVDLQDDREIFLPQLSRLGLELVLKLPHPGFVAVSGFRKPRDLV
jgi:hypothetical protein